MGKMGVTHTERRDYYLFCEVWIRDNRFVLMLLVLGIKELKKSFSLNDWDKHLVQIQQG